MMSLRVCAVLVASLFPSLLGASASAAEPSALQAREEPRWRLDVAALRGAAVHAVHSCGGWLLVEDADHGVTALDPASGGVVWFVQLDGALDPAPVASGGRIALSTPGEVVVVDTANGRRSGRLEQLAPSGAPPVSDGQLVYGTSLAGDSVDARSLHTGLTLWSFSMPRQVTALAWLEIAGALSLLVVDGSGTLRAIPAGKASPAHVIWTARAAGLAGAPLVVDRWIVAATRDQVVLCIDGGSGKRRWRHTDAQAFTGAPVVAGDVVVVGRESGLVGLSFQTGEVLWELDGAGTPRGALGDDRVLVETERGHAVLDVTRGEWVGRVRGSGVAAGGRLVTWDERALAGW